VTADTTRDGKRFEREDVPLSLVISRADAVVVVDLIGPASVRIGRDAPCEVRIDDPSVSRMHARIDIGAKCAIEDLGSRNGTRVNGALLAAGARATLSPGMVLTVGDVVALVRPRAEASLAANVPLSRTPRSPREDIVVMSAPMRAVYDLIELIAPSKLSVLILGETGVGKDVYVEALFAHSGRKGPFLRVNCAALPESLLEAELFGYERGAFTGAVAAKAGLFESADGGAVFLDEIGDMPLGTQSKLLRVLENGEVMRIGSLRPKKIDVRFLSATHCDLETLAAAGQFRSDLYFRLNGVSVTLPPLRERPEDVVPLAESFLRRSDSGATITEEAQAILMRHPWLGNVRELRNVVERAVLLSRGKAIEPAHLLFGSKSIVLPSAPGIPAPPQSWPQAPSSQSAALSVQDAVAEGEKSRILQAMAECKGNQTKAATLLGISRGTLIKRLASYGYARPFKDRQG